MTDRHLVIQLIAPAPAGGAETVVRSLLSGSADRCYRQHLVALSQTDEVSPLVRQIEASGLPVTKVRCGRRRYGREVRAVADLARMMGADLIHTHVYHADLVGTRAAARAGIPVIATAHGLTGGDWKNRLYQWLDLRALRRFDGVICVSKTLQGTLSAAGCRSDLLHMIPNAFAPGALLSRVTARRDLHLDPNAPVIAWVGRFSPEKNPLAFVDLVSQLAMPDLQAIMLGEGPLLETTRLRAAELGLNPSGLLTPGRVDYAAQYLQAFDSLVITSHTEGTPMVLLEAMAAGTPIASFAVGGIPDVLDEDAACLVPPGALPALAEGLRIILKDPDLAGRRCARAREILADRYALEEWLDRIESVYDTVLTL